MKGLRLLRGVSEDIKAKILSTKDLRKFSQNVVVGTIQAVAQGIMRVKRIEKYPGLMIIVRNRVVYILFFSCFNGSLIFS